MLCWVMQHEAVVPWGRGGSEKWKEHQQKAGTYKTYTIIKSQFFPPLKFFLSPQKVYLKENAAGY